MLASLLLHPLGVLAVIVVSALWLTAVVAPALPIIVAAITKSTAAGWVKASVLVVLAAVDALVTRAIQVGGGLTIDTKFVGAFLFAFAVAVIAHFGVLKPAGVTGSDGAVAKALPGGIG